MIILGIDASKNGSGLVISKLDENFNLIDIDYLTFTQTKKYSSDKALMHHKDKSFNDDISKLSWMKNSIDYFLIRFLHKHNSKIIDYTAIEDYSYGSIGRNQDKAEWAGTFKLLVMEKYKTNLKKYSPKTIKKFATNTGNADKTLMCQTYAEAENNILGISDDLDTLLVYNDLIDAYFINKLLLTELQLLNNKIDKSSLVKAKQDAIKVVSKIPFDKLTDNLY